MSRVPVRVESTDALYTIGLNYPLAQNTFIVLGSLISKAVDYSIGMRAVNVLRDILIKLLKLSKLTFSYVMVTTCTLTKVGKCKGVSLIAFYLLIFFPLL